MDYGLKKWFLFIKKSLINEFLKIWENNSIHTIDDSAIDPVKKQTPK